MQKSISGKPYRIISSNILKMLACISMLIDHAGVVLCSNNACMRAAGRLAFPIFAFLLAEGAVHTSNMKKYILRMLIFAFISEVPFDLAVYGQLFYPGHQNIFFTLTLGFICLYATGDTGRAGKYKVEITVASMLAAELLGCDYGMAGIGVILVFYFAGRWQDKDGFKGGGVYDLRRNLFIMAADALIYGLLLGLSQLYALLAIIPINMYNGERGRKGWKYIFYLFYPVHLLMLSIIS